MHGQPSIKIEKFDRVNVFGETTVPPLLVHKKNEYE